METTNFAGRAGRWSAAHWKTAAFGWIASTPDREAADGYMTAGDGEPAEDNLADRAEYDGAVSGA